MKAAMKTVRTIDELRAAVRAWRREDPDAAIGLVPTMGALHEGHLSLVGHALSHARLVIATIFVNPTQFGPGEDLASYPRDEARDAAMLEEAGCDLLFAPAPGEVYPPGFATEVRVRGLTDVLCGAHRQGHFDGVTQVVSKLLNQAQADVAVFGEKDWQQLAVIRRMTRDLDIPTRILGAPTQREPDGLAMSSRNRYLDAEQRQVAANLNRVLAAAGESAAAGADPREAEASAVSALIAAGFDRVDYVEIRDGETLEQVSVPDGRSRIFGAARLGRARLIDNMALPRPGATA